MGTRDAHWFAKTVKITPAWRVCLLGVTLCVALTICSRNFADRGGPHFMASLGVASVAYLLAIREFFRGRGARGPYIFPRNVVVVGLLLAAVWHIAFLRHPPGADDDIHRYVWDGRLQKLGYNPYVAVPNDPALAGLHTSETRTLNHPDLPSPYPPGAELFFRAITAIHESVFAMKVAFVLCDLAIVFVLLEVFRRTGQGKHWVLAYAWNPLLAIEVAGSGHVDILGALLLLLSFAALTRRWRATAAVTFALAIAVKFLPIVLLPLYWKRIRIRDAMLAAAIIGLLYLPFLHHRRIPTGSLGTYVHSFRFNGPIFAVLEQVASPRLLAAVAVLVGLLAATWMRRKSLVSADAFAWPLAASLFCAPVVYPWYLLWLLPLVEPASTLPLIVWTVSILPVYYVWHLRAVGQLWILPGWILLLEYGSVAAAAAIIWWRRSTEANQVTAVSD